jgi:hypothetical protein
MPGAWYHSQVHEQSPSGSPSERGWPRYEVLLGARLDASWSSWFEGMQLQPTAEGHTLLVGSIADQAALHALLARIRDLGIDLLGLHRLDEA